MSVALLAALFLQNALVAGPAEPYRVTPRATRQQSCPEQDGEDIVVCGQRYDENSPFRIPPQFRDQRSDDDRHASWEARQRDEQIVGGFSGQTLGPSGYLQAARQRDCGWRAERQSLQGRRPDCGRQHRPDDVADWQRR
ncbi:MAG: hypothetical protein ACXWUZ_14395 [Allosphingosinicella sp.]